MVEEAKREADTVVKEVVDTPAATEPAENMVKTAVIATKRRRRGNNA
jgi:hypothetical protein